MIQDVDPGDVEKMQILAKMKEYSMPAGMKIQQFLAELKNAA